MIQQPFYSFNTYLREKFGQRVHRISLNAGFNCPNLDGKLSKEGCIYCNNAAFGIYVTTPKPLKIQIEDSIAYYKKKFKVTKFIAYFQAFSNTYAPIEVLKKTYDIIKNFDEIVGLFISTRPDCINEEIMSLISSYQKNYLVWVEYGLQTTHNNVLKTLNRNHTFEDFLIALDLARKFKINVGVHIILGLPFLNYNETVQDAQRLSQLDIQGIKFHILHVLKNTKLEKLYCEGKIKLLTKEEYIKIICDFIERIPKDFVILRLISSADKNYLVAPLWMNDKISIINEITKEFKRRGTFQGYFVG
ncbi:MAG: TIGR01212 family radical SAM protein [Candidatus Omnitrophica bacterium]|nr:TIGR01212 family radical SAM protein [Candidatus Omnitrophota bacterium]